MTNQTDYKEQCHRRDKRDKRDKCHGCDNPNQSADMLLISSSETKVNSLYICFVLFSSNYL